MRTAAAAIDQAKLAADAGIKLRADLAARYFFNPAALAASFHLAVSATR
jgi:hypothetical protein